MEIQQQEAKKTLDAHRLEMIALMNRINAEVGIPDVSPTMTAQELCAKQRARGVRPEDNAASRELMQMRYGKDYEEFYGRH